MRIDIIDNFIDPMEIRTLIKQFGDIRFMKWNPYERDVYKDHNIRVGMSSPLEEFQHEMLDSKILDTAKHILDVDFHIKRAYVNAFRSDDICLPHKDYNHTTALIYCNLDYDIAYGGETFFYENDEVSEVVSPKPGRLVMFDGNVMHSPRPYTRLYDSDFRYTIAYKLGVDNE